MEAQTTSCIPTDTQPNRQRHRDSAHIGQTDTNTIFRTYMKDFKVLDKYFGFVLCFPDSFYTNFLTARPRFSVIQTDYKLTFSPKMLSPHLHLTIFICQFIKCVCGVFFFLTVC